MNHIKYLLLKMPILGNAAVVVFSSSLTSSAHAQTTLPGINLQGGGVVDFVDVVICQLAVWMFWILIALTVIFVLVAAYQYLTSAGDPSKVSSASKTIAFAAVAIVVALLAKGFPIIIITLFPSVTGINPGAGECN